IRVWKRPGSRVKKRTTSSPKRCAARRPACRGAVLVPCNSSWPRATSYRRMSHTTSVPDSSQLIFTSAWAPTACHFGKSITVNPSPGGARNEAGSRSRNRPLRSKSWTSTAWIAAPASCGPTGGAMASGNGWIRPPERSITGRSGAASSRARRKAEVTRISRSEVKDDAAVAERARQIGRWRRELRLLDRELQRLIEERVAGLLLDLVPEDAAVGPDVRQHRGGQVEPLALRDHRRHDVLFEDRVVHRGEVRVAFLGGGGGALRRAGRGSGPLRVRGLLRFRARLPCRPGQRPVHHLLPGRLAPLGSRRRRRPGRGDRGSGARGRGGRRRFLEI